MLIYREAGIDLIQARANEGRFQFQGENMRLGVFAGDDSWYIGVHRASGGHVARLSLEDAKTLKEGTDMMRFGFFLKVDDDNRGLIHHLETVGLLSAPALKAARN